MPNSGIEQRADLTFIRYGSVWEDADVLCRALAPVAKGKRLLSIASAGDNALALLTLDPREVTAVDLNPAQLACLDLRLAAFQALDHAGVLGFLGVRPEPRRQKLYEILRLRLQPATRSFWDAQPEALATGVIHAGKLERFLWRYQWLLSRLVHSPAAIEELLSEKDKAERRRYFSQVWDSWRWRLLNRIVFSKAVLGSQGRDPEFFRHTATDVTSGPRRRLDAVMQRPTHRNPYLTYHLTGNFSAAALPTFLRPEHFKAIRSRSQRVTLCLGKAEEAPGKFHGFNLSNIFEYMGPAQHQASYLGLLAKARPGARLAYWNLHVERRCPPSASARVRPLGKLAASLHAQDQSWPYGSFNLDEVRPA